MTFAFANAKPVVNPIVPDIVGKPITPREAGEAFGLSHDTIVRRIKLYLEDHNDRLGLKGYITGYTKSGKPIYATTDFWCRTHFQRLQKLAEKRVAQ